MAKLCECGCGQPTNLSKWTNQNRGIRRGEPMRFLYGHRRRLAPKTPEGFWSLVKKGDGCWEWQGPRDDDGYGMWRWNGPRERAHRIAYELEVGPIPDGMLVCHKCDNPPCCRPDHLFAGTVGDNTRDMIAKGRGRRAAPWQHVRGERHMKSKLTADLVREVRVAYCRDGMTSVALGERFGVQPANILRAVRGQTWAHVPFPLDH